MRDSSVTGVQTCALPSAEVRVYLPQANQPELSEANPAKLGHNTVKQRNRFTKTFGATARWVHIIISSRKRHARFKCDWSSDVCSSERGGEGLFAAGKSTRTERSEPSEAGS